MERFSISISSNMKRQLELMAKANFRNLNGEINKALDDYIKRNGVGVEVKEPNWWEDESEGSPIESSSNTFEPQITPAEPTFPLPHQPAPPIHQNESISTTLFSNAEIEEF